MTSPETSHHPVLWAVALGTVLVSAAALLVDAPTAVRILGVGLLVLAGVRAADRSVPSVLAARSRPFDVTVLVLGAAALLVLAPAGYLT